jgi:hypothetical protein
MSTILTAIIGWIVAILTAIIGGIVGGLIAIGGWFVQNAYERCEERKSIRAALRSEIQSILAIVERRDYVRGLSDRIEAIRAGSPDFFFVRIANDYDIIFRTNCSKVGLLSPRTAARIVRFYYLVSSAVEDINLLQDAGRDHGLQERYRLNTPDGNRHFHEEMLQLSRDAFALGRELVQELA